MSAPPKPGTTYVITSVKSKNVLDVSGDDGKSVITYPAGNGQKNQQWVLDGRYASTGEFWTIKSVSANKYLGFEDFAEDQRPLIVQDAPFNWQIVVDARGAFRFQVPHTTLEVTADKDGATSAHAILHWFAGGDNQTWTLTPVS